MQEARESVHCAADAICDGLRRLGDVLYAILPEDIAHSLGDLKKAFLTNIRDLIDWDISWVNDRVAGGDKLREEWREKCKQHSSAQTPPEPVS